MPVIVACPSCAGRLRIADALRGQRVRCPACHHTFDGEPSADVAASPLDLPLQLAIDEPSPPEPPNGGERFDERRRAWDRLDIRRREPRRDSVPDRGAVVLSLGIVSLACLMAWCAPVGIVLGLTAWIMGQSDLRKIKNGQTYGSLVFWPVSRMIGPRNLKG